METKKQKKIQSKNGITLIALIITIIVLLILAGITISQLSGNGLFGKARKAASAAEIASAKEQVEIFMVECITKYYSEGETGSIQSYIESQIPAGGKTVGGYTIKLEEETVAKVDGTKGESVKIASLEMPTMQIAAVGDKKLVVYKGTQKIITGSIGSNGNVNWDSTAVATGPITVAPTTYTLTYNAGEGTPSKASDTLEAGATISFATATRSGYVFQGWFTQASGGTEVDYTTMPASNTEIYAHWREASAEETLLGYTGNTNSNDLLVGDHINYYYKDTNNISQHFECVVLYNDATYGIQVVAANTVGSNITLGSSDFNTSKASYNSAVSTLNAAADSYVTTGGMATGGRCVGSNPVPGKRDEIEKTAGTFSSSESYFSSYNGQFKNGDELYSTDYNAMKNMTTPIHNLGKEYWLASRGVFADSRDSGFNVRHVDSDGSAYSYILCYVADCISDGSSRAIAFRPCFHLKSNIPVEKLN